MRNKFRMMLLTMATLGLFSCSDKVTDNDTPSIDEVTDGYVSFTINMIGDEMRSGMRATDDNDFTAGEEKEYAITSEYGANVAFFFDDDNKFIAKSFLQILSAQGTVSSDGHYSNNREYTFSARIRKEKGDDIKKCVLILNVNPTTFESWGEKGTSTITNLMEASNKQATLKYGEYFTMSNTVYVKTSGSGSSSYELQGPVEISDNKIYPSYEDAKSNPVAIHVERIAAKFTAEFGSNVITNNIINGTNKLKVRSSATYTAGTTDTDWGILVKGWAVNATEKQSYWIKNLNDGTNFKDGTSMTSEPTFGLWNFEYITSNKGWNDVSRLRSYWAVDPHYNATTDTYPVQYRESENATNIPFGKDKMDLILSYTAYKDIANQFSTTTNTNAAYAPENTFGAYSFLKANETESGDNANTKYAYQGDEYMRAATHILVAAQLLLGNEVTTPPATEDVVKDKWCYENNYWIAGDDNSVPSELIKYMVKQVYAEYGTTLYINTDCSTPLDLESTSLNITNYFKLVPATGMKGADGRVMLEYSPKENYKLYKKGDTTNSEVTNNDLVAHIKSVGTAKHYKNGKMYYAIPIKHMAPMKDAESGSNAEAIPHLYNIGSYGVVRNHWYKMTINGISKPGTPVDDPDDLIIPNDEPEDGGFVAFEIVIIPWHVIDWDVEL